MTGGLSPSASRPTGRNRLWLSGTGTPLRRATPAPCRCGPLWKNPTPTGRRDARRAGGICGMRASSCSAPMPWWRPSAPMRPPSCSPCTGRRGGAGRSRLHPAGRRRHGEQAPADLDRLCGDGKGAEPLGHALRGGWSDLGGWDAVWRETGPMPRAWRSQGPVTAIDCHDTLLRSEAEGQRHRGHRADRYRGRGHARCRADRATRTARRTSNRPSPR